MNNPVAIIKGSLFFIVLEDIVFAMVKKSLIFFSNQGVILVVRILPSDITTLAFPLRLLWQLMYRVNVTSTDKTLQNLCKRLVLMVEQLLESQFRSPGRTKRTEELHILYIYQLILFIL